MSRPVAAVGWVALRVVSVALGLLLVAAVRHFFGGVGVLVMVCLMLPGLVWLEMKS